MPMTDTPNFGTKYGRQGPCLRYIGPQTGTPGAPVKGGLCPAPSGIAGHSDDRVGADLCVRPDTPLRGTRSRADTQVGPYGVDRNTRQPQKSGRGQSPAPTGRSRCQAAGRCGHRPLRKGRKAAATTRASGAVRSVCGADGRKGWGSWQKSSPKCPATLDNPSVAVFGRDSSLCTREPCPAGDGGAGGHTGPPLRGHRNSQRRQTGRDRARPLREHRKCRPAGRCTEGMAPAAQISFRNLGRRS